MLCTVCKVTINITVKMPITACGKIKTIILLWRLTSIGKIAVCAIAPAADPAVNRATAGISFVVSLCSHFFICHINYNTSL